MRAQEVPLTTRKGANRAIARRKLERALFRSGSAAIHAAARTLEHKVLDFTRCDILGDDAVAASADEINVSVPSN
jgi:hypothetical protein